MNLPLILAIALLLFSLGDAAAAATMIRQVAGQRCLLSKFQPSSSNGTANKQQQQRPPVVILGGMAQSIAAWEQQHLPAFSKQSPEGIRSVLLYEGRGQGPEGNTILPLDQVSLPCQADYLKNTLDELGLTKTKTTKVDLVGFSLGGRIAMAAAVKYPEMINRLYLTGVAADRSALGELTIASWKDHLMNDSGSSSNSSSLRSFAWSILLATYSPLFLKTLQEQGKLEGILNFITRQNTKEGLLALLEQTHASSFTSSLNGKKGSMDDEWSTRAMAEKLRYIPTIQGHACVGSLDLDMAPVEQVEVLCDILGWSAPTVIPDCGHAAPMEKPWEWRNHVLEFLNQ